MDEPTRAHYFERVGFRYAVPSDEIYTVIPDVRRPVTLRRVNLLDGMFWKGVVQRFDLIACNNLLCYLHNAAVRQMLNHLTNALRTGGYLMVAPAEAALITLPRLEPLNDAPAFFRRIA